MCDLDIPDNAVILNQVHIVEYIDPLDDEIYKADLSTGGDGSDIAMGKALELIEWARAFTVSPLIADMIHEFVWGDDDEEDEEDEEAVV